jgi:hypothetical protein
MRQDVRILPQNGNQVFAADCHVRKDDADWIEWINYGDKDFVIHFDDTPFDRKDFTVKAGQTMTSGPIHQRAAAKAYKYDIQTTGKASVVAADPNVIIH